MTDPKAPAPDRLTLTLARIIVAVERRRRPVVIDGGKPMLKSEPRRR